MAYYDDDLLRRWLTTDNSSAPARSRPRSRRPPSRRGGAASRPAASGAVSLRALLGGKPLFHGRGGQPFAAEFNRIALRRHETAAAEEILRAVAHVGGQTGCAAGGGELLQRIDEHGADTLPRGGGQERPQRRIRLCACGHRFTFHVVPPLWSSSSMPIALSSSRMRSDFAKSLDSRASNLSSTLLFNSSIPIFSVINSKSSFDMKGEPYFFQGSIMGLTKTESKTLEEMVAVTLLEESRFE